MAGKRGEANRQSSGTHKNQRSTATIVKHFTRPYNSNTIKVCAQRAYQLGSAVGRKIPQKGNQTAVDAGDPTTLSLAMRFGGRNGTRNCYIFQFCQGCAVRPHHQFLCPSCRAHNSRASLLCASDRARCAFCARVCPLASRHDVVGAIALDVDRQNIRKCSTNISLINFSLKDRVRGRGIHTRTRHMCWPNVVGLAVAHDKNENFWTCSNLIGTLRPNKMRTREASTEWRSAALPKVPAPIEWNARRY